MVRKAGIFLPRELISAGSVPGKRLVTLHNKESYYQYTMSSLFVPERLDRVLEGRFSGGVNAEENADSG